MAIGHSAKRAISSKQYAQLKMQRSAGELPLGKAYSAGKRFTKAITAPMISYAPGAWVPDFVNNLDRVLLRPRFKAPDAKLSLDRCPRAGPGAAATTGPLQIQ